MWVKSAVPSTPSASAAAWIVTVLFVFQFVVVKVSEAPLLTERSPSWPDPALRATLTVTFPVGFVARRTW